MADRSRRARLKWLCVISIICALAFGAIRGYRFLEEADHIGQLVTQGDFIRIALGLYVEDHHEFPEKLADLNEPGLGYEGFSNTLTHEKVEYYRPKTNDTGDAVILRIYFKSYLIEVNKDLNQKEGKVGSLK